MSVSDCERVQTQWFRVRAEAAGGAVWTDGGMLWTDGPDGLNVMFPDVLDTAALRQGVSYARESGHSIVGAWLGLHVDAAPLAATGFTRGWSPWWMTADLDDVPHVEDPRVHVRQTTADGDDAHQDRVAAAHIWCATAHAEDSRPAGRAWTFVDHDLAGIFDMDVWPSFRRQGVGTALLSAVCGAAREAGALHAVLNATPEGKSLYGNRGFTQIGEGITWWCHLGR